jgi:hypothetical protein
LKSEKDRLKNALFSDDLALNDSKPMKTSIRVVSVPLRKSTNLRKPGKLKLG